MVEKLPSRRTTVFFDARPVCRFGTKCYRRNVDHLKSESHPADADYLHSCREKGARPEFISIRQLFEWCDPSRSGKAKRGDLDAVWPTVQSLSTDVGPMDDELWAKMDDDGNGYVNFSEFCEFATCHQIGLPLGLDDLLGVDGEAALCCGVVGCMCRNFEARRRRCKYGEGCYQTTSEHKASFCHPADADWASSGSGADRDMCRCGHKRKLHASSATFDAAVEYPSYWTLPSRGEGEFNERTRVDDGFRLKLQQLVDRTYSDKTTRDRNNHTGSWMVPRGFEMVDAWRNENSRLWRKYCVRKAEIQKEKELLESSPELSKELPPYSIFDDVLTSSTWKSLDDQVLDMGINEWYLFHGTSVSAAQNICANDFKMRLAGSATGTLYGRGSYLAESITKADEYSKREGEFFTVLLCRVLGGRVRYCDERTPDAEALTKDCVEGPFDCIIGDRVKTSGTYREFVIFDAENVYPEYILKYRRGELFKSSSYPGGGEAPVSVDSTPITDPVKLLVSMGFTAEQAKTTLDATDGDIERAAAMLVFKD